MATRYQYGKPVGQLSKQRQKQEFIKWSHPPNMNDLKGILGGVTPSYNPAPGSRQPELRLVSQEFIKVGRERRKELRGTRDEFFDYSTVLNHFVLTRFAGMGAGMLRMWDRYKNETQGYVVRSSFIHTILHNASTPTIVIIMRGGNAYYYGNQSTAKFKDFLNAVSKGVYYNKNIKRTGQGPGGRSYKETYAGRW